MEIERHWEGSGKMWEGRQVCRKVGNCVREKTTLSGKRRRRHGSGDVAVTTRS